jgi:CubicO group peptidase (beta-lactamase class C family)
MSTPDDGLATSRARAIDRLLDDWLVEADVPGGSVAVFDDDGILYATGLGSRDRESNAPATPDTLYNVGSITKVVTAIAVLQQVEQETLSLDDEIAEHVSLLADVPGDPITVRELLTHSSGMPSDFVAYRDNIADRQDLRLHVEGATDHRLTDDPPVMYYNSGYKILGELVAAVGGRSYTDYVEQEVLAPLDMDRSTFDQEVLWEDDDAMTGYRPEGEDRVPTEHPLDFEVRPAAGGLIGPVTELTRLLRCLLDGGELDGSRLLDAETVRAMASEHVQWQSTIDGDDRCYGYGLVVEQFLGDRLLGHAGSVSHSMAYAGGLADRGLGVALAVNTTDVRIGTYGRGVLAIAAGESPVETVPGLALQEKLDAVTGTYEAYRGPAATVEADGGYLTVTLSVEGHDDSVTAVPVSSTPDDYSFYVVRDDGRRDAIEFRETDDGLVLLLARFRLNRQ